MGVGGVEKEKEVANGQRIDLSRGEVAQVGEAEQVLVPEAAERAVQAGVPVSSFAEEL